MLWIGRISIVQMSTLPKANSKLQSTLLRNRKDIPRFWDHKGPTNQSASEKASEPELEAPSFNEDHKAKATAQWQRSCLARVWLWIPTLSPVKTLWFKHKHRYVCPME